MAAVSASVCDRAAIRAAWQLPIPGSVFRWSCSRESLNASFAQIRHDRAQRKRAAAAQGWDWLSLAGSPNCTAGSWYSARRIKAVRLLLYRCRFRKPPTRRRALRALLRMLYAGLLLLYAGLRMSYAVSCLLYT